MITISIYKKTCYMIGCLMLFCSTSPVAGQSLGCPHDHVTNYAHFLLARFFNFMLFQLVENDEI